MSDPLRRGLAGQVLGMLRERVLTGELPPGARINEVELARELKISRGPLREAIWQLVSEGLLLHTPNKGTTVITAGPDDLTALFDLRTALECAAARLAARRGTPDAARSLSRLCAESRETFQAGQKFPYHLDLAFHRALAEAARSPRIAEQTWRAQQHVIVLRSVRGADAAHSYASMADHEAITEAVARGAGDEAAALMDTHLERVREQLLAAMVTRGDASPDQAPASPGAPA